MTQEVKKRIDQIRHGIVPEGYRKAGTDIIPSDWDKSPFRQLGVIASGLVDPQKQPYSEMQHIGPDCIEKDTGRIFETKSASELRLISGKFYFDSDSIVYSKIRPNLNKVCAPPFEGICSADCYSIKPTGKIEKAYLFNLMLGYNFYKRAVACSMRTGMPKINQDDLNNIDISYPKSTTEQKKIAEILTTQDKVIVLEQQKIEEIIKEKQFFLEKMFPKKGEAVPEIRFKGFTGPWEQRKLGDVATEIIAGGDVDKELMFEEGRYPVIANALTNDGIVGYYNDRYRIKAPAVTVTGRGDVGHAKARNVDFTPVVRLLSVKSNHDVFFLENAINTLKIVIESTGVPQLTVPQLAKYEIFFPKNLNEEEKIGQYFANLDRLITLHQRKLAEEKKKKKALMQLLLTGIVRV